jgi:hypothetical protein
VLLVYGVKLRRGGQCAPDTLVFAAIILGCCRLTRRRDGLLLLRIGAELDYV